MALQRATKEVEILQDGFPKTLGSAELTGDLYADGFVLAEAAYTSLGGELPWADLPVFQKEQMRSAATHVYFFGGGATAFEVAVLVACGKPDPTPTLASLDPATAICLDPVDVTMKCIGTGFTNDSEIFFGGRPERTDFVSPNEVSTIVTCSLFPNPDPNIPVFVRTPTLMDTETLAFSFTLAGAGTMGRKRNGEEEKHRQIDVKDKRR